MTENNQAAEDRRARRHVFSSSSTSNGPCCPKCNQMCASDFGLSSHLRSHDFADDSWDRRRHANRIFQLAEVRIIWLEQTFCFVCATKEANQMR